MLTNPIIGVNAADKNYGDAAVSAVGAVTRIMTLGTYVIFEFLKGFQPVVGYYYGAKRYDRVQEAVRPCLIWSSVFCGLTAVVFIFCPEPIITLFAKDSADMVAIGAKALRANGILFPFFGFQMVFMYLFLSVGEGRRGGILSICRQGLFFVPLILLLPHLFGLGGIIWAQPTSDAFSVIVTSFFAVGSVKRLNTLRRCREAAVQGV